MCVSLISIYWGACYGTDRYFFKVKNIVVLQDAPSNTSVQSISAIIPSLLASVPGTWHIYNATSFHRKFGTTNSTEIDRKIVDLIYDERYWLALNVKPNATDTLYNSLISQDANSEFNSSIFLNPCLKVVVTHRVLNRPFYHSCNNWRSAFRNITSKNIFPH